MVRILLRVSVSVLVCLTATAAAWADGTVYAMTNALANNQVLVYHRAADGPLTLIQTINTGGGGSGLQLAGVDGLGSAGSMQLDANHHLLFVVNTETAAENNGAGAYNTDCEEGTITSFRIAADGTLTFADRVLSRGMFPNSLTVRLRSTGNPFVPKELLYVLNAGGPEPPAICHPQPASAAGPNITGFTVDQDGAMKPLLSSTQPIDPGPASAPDGVSCTSAAAAGFSGLTGAPAADFQCGLNPPSFSRSPGQIRFTPGADQLVVTEKGTNTIYVFPVNSNGTAGVPTTTQALGPALPTYLGFAFDSRGNMLLTESFGSSTSIPSGGTGAVSSFAISAAGNLSQVSSDVADGGTDAGWIILEPITKKFAFVANNLSASISSYSVGTSGTLTLLNGTAAGVAGPNDLATAQEGTISFLYVLEAGTGTIGAFRINTDGSLTALTGAGGLPVGHSAQGIAAY